VTKFDAPYPYNNNIITLQSKFDQNFDTAAPPELKRESARERVVVDRKEEEVGMNEGVDFTRGKLRQRSFSYALVLNE